MCFPSLVIIQFFPRPIGWPVSTSAVDLAKLAQLICTLHRSCQHFWMLSSILASSPFLPLVYMSDQPLGQGISWASLKSLLQSMCSIFYQNSRLTFVCMSISASPTREWLGLMLLLVLSIFHPLSTVLPFHCCPICPRQTLLLECNIRCQLYLVQKLSQMISPVVSFSNSSHLRQQSGQQLLHAPHHTSHCTSVDLELANFTIIWDYSAKKSKWRASCYLPVQKYVC